MLVVIAVVFWGLAGLFIWMPGGNPVPVAEAVEDWAGNLHTEAAWQTDASSTPVDYSAFYGHVFFAASQDKHKVTLGYEHLGEDLGTVKATGAPAGISFRTPLATAHAFNGFADAFVGARIGGTPGGIGDLYVSYSTMLPAEIKFLAALH